VNLELVGIEDKVVEAIVLVYLGVDCEAAVVAELAAELDVVEGDGVVCWLDPSDFCQLFHSPDSVLRSRHAHQAGRMSLSEAMSAKLLVTSDWQNLLCTPNALGLVRANLGLDREVSWSCLGLEEKLLEPVVG